MKYRKLTLDLTTIGMIMDRLNKLVSNGIIKIEGAYGNINPTRKDIAFTTSPSVYRNQKVEFRKHIMTDAPYLLIPPVGIKWYGGTAFNFGDIFYLGNNVIFVKSSKSVSSLEETSITKITLLSRSDAPHAMEAYRENIRSMINMACYYDDWDRDHVPDHEVDDFIAYKEKRSTRTRSYYLDVAQYNNNDSWELDEDLYLEDEDDDDEDHDGYDDHTFTPSWLYDDDDDF